MMTHPTRTARMMTRMWMVRRAQTVKSEETQESGDDTASAPSSESGSSVSASKVDSDTLLMPPPPPGPIPDRSPAPALATEAKSSSSSAPTVSPLAAMHAGKIQKCGSQDFLSGV